MCSVKLRRVALMAAAVGVLAAAAGACGGDSAINPTPDDGGAAGDMAGARGDLGQGAADGGADSVTLLSPVPLSSLVPTSTTFQLQAVLTDLTPQSLEPYIEIVPHTPGADMSNAPLSGAFNWKGSGSTYQINFIPAAVADMTDYVVTVGSPSGATLLKTGISTGSMPRVTRVELHSENNGQTIYFLFSFSEPMDLSTLSQDVSASFGTTNVAGAVSPVDTTGQSFRCDVNSASSSKSPIQFIISAAAKATSGHALVVADWDSSTSMNGNFVVSFTPTTPLANVPSAVYTFTPTIN